MKRIAIGCIVDGFSGPSRLNVRSLAVVEKVIDLLSGITDARYDVEIWIPRWEIFFPGSDSVLYKVVYDLFLYEWYIPADFVYLTPSATYNALSDGGALAENAVMRPKEEYIFAVPNFPQYFSLTYRAMRKHMGDGKDWENLRVVSVSGSPAPFKARLLYGALTCITFLVSQNKWLWTKWFNLRAREKERRRSGFVCTVGS